MKFIYTLLLLALFSACTSTGTKTDAPVIMTAYDTDSLADMRTTIDFREDNTYTVTRIGKDTSQYHGTYSMKGYTFYNMKGERNEPLNGVTLEKRTLDKVIGKDTVWEERLYQVDDNRKSIWHLTEFIVKKKHNIIK